MSSVGNKISNLPGVILPAEVRRQFFVRSTKNISSNFGDTNSTEPAKRDLEDLSYIANKNCWVRLVSSIDIHNEELLTQLDEGLKLLQICDPQSLAKNFVLFGGTSIYSQGTNNTSYSYNLRSGLGQMGSYGILGEEEIKQFGYKPMPGITDVKVTTMGKLGSVRSATINIKVWDKMQLDIMDMLYFKLGYTMFLEWGHVMYYTNGVTNKSDSRKGTTPVLTRASTNVNPFGANITKESLGKQMFRAIEDASCNYDAMLGMCTKFTYSLNQDGGFDCSVELQALGTLADAMKINQPQSLPGYLKFEVEKFVDIANTKLKTDAQAKANEANQLAQAAADKAKSDAAASIPETTTIDEFLKAPSPKGLALTDAQIAAAKFIPAQYKDKPDYLVRVAATDSVYSKRFGVGYSSANSNIGWPAIIKPFATDGGWDDPDKVNPFSQVAAIDSIDLDPTLMKNAFGWFKYDIENGGKPENFGLNEIYSRYSPLDDYDRRSTFVLSLPGKITPLFIDYAIEDFKKAIGQSTKIDKEQGNRNPTERKIIQGDFDALGNFALYCIIESFSEGQNSISQTPDGAYLYTSDKLQNIGLDGWDQVSVSIQKQNLTIPYDNVAMGYVVNSKSQVAIYKAHDAQNRGRNSYNQLVSDKESYYYHRVKGTISIKIFFKKSATDQYPQVKETTIPYILTFFETSLISNITPSSTATIFDEAAQVKRAAAVNAITAPEIKNADEFYTKIDASEIQNEEASKYTSGLEIFLRAIQLRTLNSGEMAGINNLLGTDPKPIVYSLASKNPASGKPFAHDIFANGVFTKIITDCVDANGKVNNDVLKEDKYKVQDNTDNIKTMLSYAARGFSHNLMKSARADEAVNYPTLNIESLLTSYVFPYFINQGVVKGCDFNFPVYIPFGLLMMGLNHMCTLYDSPAGNSVPADTQKPLVYFDFNPETNFCLSEPLHFSSDPFKFLIPFYGTNEEYKKLFTSDIIVGNKIGKDGVDLFEPETQNVASGYITQKHNFKTDTPYKAKIMNALVNVDYLLKICHDYATKDDSHSLYMKQFIEQILTDFNKSLGDINIFRLAYDDYSNCYYVTDDQYMKLDSADQYVTSDSSLSATLPLYGLQSIAKSLEVKTDISNKISNYIAICANSNITADVSKDTSAFAVYSKGMQDRYVPQKTSINATDTGSIEARAKESEISVASQFNNVVKGIYYQAKVSEDAIGTATNYLIQKLSKRKGTQPATLASSIIPITVNFSTDGIGGLTMGHTFLLPDELMPLSYKRTPNGSRVGFAIMGLDHTIANNSWTTNIRANMVYLKEEAAFNIVQGSYMTNLKNNGAFNRAQVSMGDSSTNITGADTNFVGTNTEAKTSIETYLGRTISDSEFTELISATFAEASRNQEERAYVMGTILNRSRKKSKTISEVLREKNQFQSVTGTANDNHQPSPNFINGPNSTNADSIYGAAINLLSKVPKDIVNFTANNLAAYGAGTNPGYIQTLKDRGGFVIGQTIFSS